jgi:hypothetical protein
MKTDFHPTAESDGFAEPDTGHDCAPAPEPGQQKPTKGARGGSREGAGRRAIDGASRTKSHTIRLDDQTREFFMSLGNNQLSAGIRKAARKLMNDEDAATGHV